MDSLIYEVILHEKANIDDQFLSPQDCDALLEDGDSVEQVHPSDTKTSEDILNGYPVYPLYKKIATVLTQIMDTGDCQVVALQSHHLLDEATYCQHRSMMMETLVSKLQGLKTLWDNWSRSEQTFHVRHLLKDIGKRGILDLLGMRKTVGTVDIFPPSKSTLLNSFNKPNKESSKLTVGARALAKHCHRDETSSWWGTAKGGEDAKNKHASEIVLKILDDTSWINIHALPHDVHVIEVRQSAGYGARWTADGSMFRGFLEPQMEDGHEAGWKH